MLQRLERATGRKAVRDAVGVLALAGALLALSKVLGAPHVWVLAFPLAIRSILEWRQRIRTGLAPRSSLRKRASES